MAALAGRDLVEHGADICGLNTLLFYAPESRRGWRYVYDGQEPWVCGGTLCYAKAYWAREASEVDCCDCRDRQHG